jgi:hypothetical protein
MIMKQICYDDTGSFLGCTLPGNPDLIAEGWERRFIADPRMAAEAVETYTELGFEVKLEPVKTDGLQEECSGCKGLLERFNMVYTRKK